MRLNVCLGGGRRNARWLGLGALLLGLVGLGFHLRARRPPLAVRTTPPKWALDLYEHHLPAISWATARVALGEPRSLIDVAFEPVRGGIPSARVARVLKDLDRRLTRPGLDPDLVRDHFETLNSEMHALGLPLYADVQFERVPAETGRWVVWIRTYRVTAVRRAETSEQEHVVHWLDRLDALGASEDRLGWKKARESNASVLLDVVLRHWREDLAPRLALKPRGRHRHHLYAQLRPELLADLERAIPGPVVDDIECRARFGALLWIDSAEDLPDEALSCHALARSLEPRIVEFLARRVEQHELQHAIDARDLATPIEVQALCATQEEISCAEVTAEVSAVLAEAARGPEPRLALAHFLSLGAELGRAHKMAARVVMEAMGREGEGAVSLLRRPRGELSLRAHGAYRALFGRGVHALRVQDEALAAVQRN